ncbi:STAS domain-containing protein [Pseudonocardia saturnea]
MAVSTGPRPSTRTTTVRCSAARFRPLDGSDQRRAGDGEPQRLPDLEMRLHMPLPDVVIVRVAGIVDNGNGPAVAVQVAQQLDRASDVILDLRDVRAMGPGGVDMLLDLHRGATTRGARLHIAGADRQAMAGRLQHAGAHHVLSLVPCADAVVALLACRRYRAAGPDDDAHHDGGRLTPVGEGQEGSGTCSETPAPRTRSGRR